MAFAWFICSFITYPDFPNRRYCAMDNFSPQIKADGGKWVSTEILGGYALVKVKANDTTITAIGNTNGFFKVTDHFILNDSLADLTNPQRNAIQNQMLLAGYTQAEIDSVMGNTLALWRQKTFITLLNFVAQRRFKARFDFDTQEIVLDGILQECKPPIIVDSEVI